MGAPGGLGGFAIVVAVTLTAVVANRLRQPAHRRPLKELVPWRVVTAALALGVMGATLWSAASHTLACVRGAGGVDCVVETKRLFGQNVRREVPGVVGAELEDRVVLDRNDDPEQQSRLVLVTRAGRVPFAGFGEVDPTDVDRELRRFLAGDGTTRLDVGSDARVMRLAMAWTWLVVAVSALFVRW